MAPDHPPGSEMRANNILVVNADDFGQSSGVTRGIIESFERGIVTSTSLMVHWPAARDAARYARANPKLSVGLHLDYGEWAFRNQEWIQLYKNVDVSDVEQVRSEALRQLDHFRDLIGNDPTHLDSHQHAHLSEPIRSAAVEIARSLRVPLRHCSPEVDYCGSFYGQSEQGDSYHEAIQAEALVELFGALRSGTTELACHPGYADDLCTMYRDERALEICSLCSQAVRSALSDFGIQLKSFREVNVMRRPDGIAWDSLELRTQRG
jgi:chitin disaccharide deacetylase